MTTRSRSVLRYSSSTYSKGEKGDRRDASHCSAHRHHRRGAPVNTETSSPAFATGHMATEPARVLGLLSTAVASVLALLVVFGVNLTEGQVAGILGVIAGVGPLVTAFLIRGKVYSPASVRRLVKHGVEVGVVVGEAHAG